MNPSSHNRWLHRFSVLTALATLALIGIGGLVTSHEAGMSVPDWPNSYGYNMFLFPPSKWIGGVLYEHTHRLWATMVGLLVVALTRWLGGRVSRRPLAIVGALEMLGGIVILSRWPNLAATGGFLAGIGGIVLLASLVWVRNEAAPGPLPLLGWIVFGLVQIQGLLGGLRVVMFKDEIGIFHGTLAQLFFVLTCAIALLTSKWWMSRKNIKKSTSNLEPRTSNIQSSGVLGLRQAFLFATVLILFQLILGATMRHQHAGLSIPDFPLAYGKLWPATDPASIVQYNAQRVEITNINPITAFQIDLQMAHRLTAVLILAAVALCAWKVRNQRWIEFPAIDHPTTPTKFLPPHEPVLQGRDLQVASAQELPRLGRISERPALRQLKRHKCRAPVQGRNAPVQSGKSLPGGEGRGEGKRELSGTSISVRGLCFIWLGLILLQACLGAATVLSNKAADIATAHVLVGAISLATGAVLSIIVFRFPQLAVEAPSKAPILVNSSAGNFKGAAGVDPAGNMSAAR